MIIHPTPPSHWCLLLQVNENGYVTPSSDGGSCVGYQDDWMVGLMRQDIDDGIVYFR